jgi:hypothetical protein
MRQTQEFGRVALITYLNLPADRSSKEYLQLKTALDLFLELAQGSFSYIKVYDKKKLEEAYPADTTLTHDYREYYSKALEEKKMKFPESWLEMGLMRWKPYLLVDALKEFNSKVDYVFYHDINIFKYPCYKQNISKKEKDYLNLFRGSDFLIFETEYKPFLKDCKRLLIDRYFGSDPYSKYQQSYWAGAFAVKANDNGLSMALNWCEMATVDNCAPLPDIENRFDGFKWHSQEQAVLSLLVYEWKRLKLNLRVLVAPKRSIFKKFKFIYKIDMRLKMFLRRLY